MRSHALFRSAVIVALLSVPAARAAAPDTPAARAPGRGEAVVWYLGHRGYAVRTQSHLLIFDYQEKRDGPAPRTRPARPSLENGFVVPADLKDLRVRVFVSHSHGDHYDPVILEWKKTIPDVEYYFGWKASDDTALHCLVGPRAELKSGGLEIATINSHHSGVPEVAWLVKVDGLALYHNGDCQPEFQPEHAYLRTRAERIDLAFVMRVHEEDLRYGQQNADFFRRFRPRAVFPMHDTAGSDKYEEFARAFGSKMPRIAIFPPRRLGERFIYRGGVARRDSTARVG